MALNFLIVRFFIWFLRSKIRSLLSTRHYFSSTQGMPFILVFIHGISFTWGEREEGLGCSEDVSMAYSLMFSLKTSFTVRSVVFSCTGRRVASSEAEQNAPLGETCSPGDPGGSFSRILLVSFPSFTISRLVYSFVNFEAAWEETSRGEEGVCKTESYFQRRLWCFHSESHYPW